jgi:hypothetical protein
MTAPQWKIERFHHVTSHVIVVGGVYLGKVEEYDPAGYPDKPSPTASVYAPEFSDSARHPDVAAAKKWCEQTIKDLFLQTLDFAEGK